MAANVTPTNPDAADAENIAEEWRQRTLAEIPNVPDQRRKTLSMEMFYTAKDVYLRNRSEGKASGQSRIDTNREMDAELTEIAQEEGVQRTRANVNNYGDSSLPRGTYPVGVEPEGGGDGHGGAGSTFTSADRQQGLDTYRGGIKTAQGTLQGIINDPTNDPNARNVGRKIVGYRPKLDANGQPIPRRDALGQPMVDKRTGLPVFEQDPVYGEYVGVQGRDVAAAQAGAIDPIEVARQGRTVLEKTNTADLDATARGEGAGSQAALLRIKQGIQRAAQVASGTAAQARGSERRGARALGLLQGSETALDAIDRAEERNQADRQFAQAKVAEIDAATKRAQADLDAAKAANDQAAINAANTRIAELKAEREKFNVGEANRVATDNANRDVSVQTTNIVQERAGITEGANQDREDSRLRMDATKAVADLGKGLLDEESRQAAIKNAEAQLQIARDQLQLAKDEFAYKKAKDQFDFWTGILQGLVSGAAKVATGAARGGLVKGPKVLVGEGEHAELVIPIKGRLTKRLEKALAIENEPFADPVPVAALMGAIKRHLSKKDEDAPKSRRRSGDVTAMLAAFNVKMRKAQ